MASPSLSYTIIAVKVKVEEMEIPILSSVQSKECADPAAITIFKQENVSV